MSAKLRKYLDDNMMSANKFGREANINITTLWHLFRGRRISRMTALKIQKATKGIVKLSDFDLKKCGRSSIKLENA